MILSLFHSTSSFKLQLNSLILVASPIHQRNFYYLLPFVHSPNVWPSPFGRTIKCFPFSCLFFSACFIFFSIPGASFATSFFQEPYVHVQHQVEIMPSKSKALTLSRSESVVDVCIVIFCPDVAQSELQVSVSWDLGDRTHLRMQLLIWQLSTHYRSLQRGNSWQWVKISRHR